MSDLLRKVAAHIRHLQAERHRNGRAGWKNKREEERHIHRKGDTREYDRKEKKKTEMEMKVVGRRQGYEALTHRKE